MSTPEARLDAARDRAAAAVAAEAAAREDMAAALSDMNRRGAYAQSDSSPPASLEAPVGEQDRAAEPAPDLTGHGPGAHRITVTAEAEVIPGPAPDDGQAEEA